jgi:hypothetical protein
MAPIINQWRLLKYVARVWPISVMALALVALAA